MKVPAACLFTLLAFIFSARVAAAQTMSFSVYNEPSVGDGIVESDADVIDYSSGCSHGGYQTTVRVQSPSGRLGSDVFQGLSGSAWLPIDAEFGDYMLATTTSYTCSCIHGGTAYAGGSTVVNVPTPTTASPYNWATQSGNPPGCSAAPNYWFVRDYQVLDQQQPGQPIQRVMAIGESFSNEQPNPNCFNVALGAGGGPSQSNGTYRDNIYLCNSPVCNSGGSCTFTRNQTWTADGATLNPVFLMTYSCSTASVR
jgi:hypothetical protein